MTTGARIPEELDTLLEDAFVLRDESAFDALFAHDAVLGGARGLEARGAPAIREALVALWAGEHIYVAGDTRVLRLRDTALVVATGAIHVARRGGDRTWRAAISLLDLHTPMIGPEDT